MDGKNRSTKTSRNKGHLETNIIFLNPSLYVNPEQKQEDHS